MTAQATGSGPGTLRPESWEDKLTALEMLVYFKGQLPSYYKPETDLSARKLGIRDLLVPGKKTGKPTTYE